MPAIEGLHEFESKLKRLDLAVQYKGLQTAVKAGSAVIQRAAVQNIQSEGLVLTGRLGRREIISINQAVSNAYVVVARIGPALDAFYGAFPEFGTIHQPEQPFLTPAFEQEKNSAVAAASAELKTIVERAVI